MNNKYFELAFKEAKKGCLNGEIPVGCVIVFNNRVISKACNMKELKNDPTLHAEILAIRKATKKMKNWRLNGCSLYTTIKPCLMCMGAIMESRISEVNYLIETNDIKNYYNNIIVNKCNYLEKESFELLKNFFADKRK